MVFKVEQHRAVRIAYFNESLILVDPVQLAEMRSLFIGGDRVDFFQPLDQIKATFVNRVNKELGFRSRKFESILRALETNLEEIPATFLEMGGAARDGFNGTNQFHIGKGVIDQVRGEIEQLRELGSSKENDKKLVELVANVQTLWVSLSQVNEGQWATDIMKDSLPEDSPVRAVFMILRDLGYDSGRFTWKGFSEQTIIEGHLD